jgi:hypothetical protein
VSKSSCLERAWGQVAVQERREHVGEAVQKGCADLAALLEKRLKHSFHVGAAKVEVGGALGAQEQLV